jgi:hypothetical protein
MPLSTAAKAALCLCPPAVMAGTVATVPSVKRAVHHLTAPHHARPVHRIATAAARPAAEPVAADCNPVAPGPLPAVPLVTYAAPIPAEPTEAASGAPGSTGSILAPQAPVATVGGVGLGSPGTTTPVVTPPVVTPTPAPTVPEPASWLMMIVGAGVLGAAVRRRRRAVAAAGRPLALGTTLWAGSAAEAGDVAATAAVQSGAAKSALATAAGKAMLCVCPAAVVAGSVVAVPPLRHAVHAATMPAPAPLTHLRTVPCDPAVAVPVSATAVQGYPDTVSTAVKPS